MFASEVGRLSHGTFVPSGAPAFFPWSARPAQVLKVVLEFFFAECFEPVCARAGVAFKNLHDKPFFGTHVECSFRSGVNSQSGGARADRERITRVGPQYFSSARNARQMLQDLVSAVLLASISRIETFRTPRGLIAEGSVACPAGRAEGCPHLGGILATLELRLQGGGQLDRFLHLLGIGRVHRPG